MSDAWNSFKSLFSTGVWSVLSALFLLIVAFLVAALVKKLVLKLLKKVNAERFLGKTGITDQETGSSLEFVGKFVYLIVFLLFVPGIFQALGLDNVASPITGLLESIWGFVPNLLAAAIILVVGFFIARLVRQLLVPVFDRIKLSKVQEKLGIQVTEENRLSTVLAYIVYVLILIPVIIAALTALNIQAISQPAIGMLESIFAFIPNILVAIILVVVGVLIAKLAGEIVERVLAATGLDEKLQKLLPQKEGMKSFVLSKTVGMILRVVLIIFFVVEAVNVLQLSVLTQIGSAIVAYMPQLLSAVIIIGICLFAGSIAEKAILSKTGSSVYSIIVKTAILTVGAFMVLNQLGIATQIVNAAFVLILAALAVAFAVAFGIGGRDFASRTLSKLEKSTDASVKKSTAPEQPQGGAK